MPEFTVVRSLPPPDATITDIDRTPAEAGLLAEIKRRESGGNYEAKNPDSTASGAYQFINSTWRYASDRTGVPRYARASDAPQDVQDANALYMLRNFGPNAKITWAASGPYAAGKGSAARAETAPATNGIPTTVAPAVMAAASASAAPVTLEDVDRILRGIQNPPAAAAPPESPPEPAFSVVRSLPPPPPTPPTPPPENLSTVAKTFWQDVGGPQVVEAVKGLVTGDPAKAEDLAVSIAKGLWNEPGRIRTEITNALNASKFADFESHLTQAVPFVGPTLQASYDAANRGAYAEGLGHGLAVGAQVYGPKALEAAPEMVSGAAQAMKESPVGRAAAAAAPDVAKGTIKAGVGGAVASVVPGFGKWIVGTELTRPGLRQIVTGLKKGAAEFRTTPEAAAAAPAAEAAAMTPGQILAKSQGQDWATLSANDQAMLEQIAQGQANVATQPVARPAAPPAQAPEAPATPAAPVTMNREMRRATVMPPETGVPEAVERAQLEREAIIGKPRDQWTNSDVLAADQLRAEGYTGAQVPPESVTQPPAPPLTPQDLTELTTGRSPSRQSEAAQQTAAETLATAQAAAPPAAPAAPEAPPAAPAVPPVTEAPTAPLAGKPKAAEIARQLENEMRAGLLTDYLKANQVPRSMVERFGEKQWDLVARGARTQPPTPEQIAEITKNLADSEQAANLPPEVAQMPTAQAEAALAPALKPGQTPAQALAEMIPESAKAPPPPGPPAATASELRIEALARHFANETNWTPEMIAKIAKDSGAALQLEKLSESLGIEGRPAPGEIQKIAKRVRELRRAGRKPQ